MEGTFAKWIVKTGGNSGGGKNQRAFLEQAIGQVYLDRMNGYPVGNVAQMFQALGGTDPTAIKALTNAFGDNFDRVAQGGASAIGDAIKTGLGNALHAEGLNVPTTTEFRDLLFSTDSTTTLGTLRSNVTRTPTTA